jgi:IS5 family transposase
MIETLPTRAAVSKAWEAYSKLCQAAADDPQLLSDAGYCSARDSAHARWSRAFMMWDGK